MEEKNYERMSGSDLVAEYNRLRASLNRPPLEIKKFESKLIGIRRIKALEDEIAGGVPEFLNRSLMKTDAQDETTTTNREPPPEVTEERKIFHEADRRWRNWVPDGRRIKRPRKGFFVREILKERRAVAREARKKVRAKASLKTSSSRRRMDQVIRVTCANPRREGTEARRYFDAMVGGPTVGEYLAKFPTADHRKAIQWLWNTCRDGYAEVLG